ncbi:leucine-rich repeat domain-containing protein [Treponema sp. R80B11-R83G3]
MKKNIILVVALLALMVFSVFAQDAESDFKVTKLENAISITKYLGSKSTVNIPSKIQNLPVTEIGAESFSGRDITSVIIPNSVTSIGERAFYRCQSLTSVTIPNSVKSIGQRAFLECGLTGIIIPDSVTSIDKSTFSLCKSLTSITIPSSITSIGEQAFNSCSSLTSVTFSGTIPSAEFHADAFRLMGDIRAKFYATDNEKGTPGTYTTEGPLSTKRAWTKQVGTTTPATVQPATAQPTVTPAQTGDPESDFRVSKSVTKTGNTITITGYVGNKSTVIIPSSIQNLPVTEIGGGAFFQKTGITSVTIPNSVTTIERTAFSSCAKLTSITIPDSVTYIGMQAFFECTSLTNVTIPNSVTILGQGVFMGCTSLTSVTIGNGVTTIDAGTFSRCTSLTSVTIGSGVTNIRANAFDGCTNITSVTFNGTIPSANFIDRAFVDIGDLRAKFYATDKAKGTPGTYTRPDGTSTTWTKK